MVVGRGNTCAIVVPSEKASRQHARFVVSDEGTFVEDLKSTNGVVVNDVLIRGRAPIAAGDRVLIGDTALDVVRMEEIKRMRRGHRLPAELTTTIVAETEDPEAAGPQAQTLELLSKLVDKVLALGRADEAARLLRGPLERVLRDAERGLTVEADVSAMAARYELKLASATAEPYWIELLLRTHTALGRLLPLPIVDELHGVVRSVKGVNPALLRAYVERLRAGAGAFGPTDRFALGRIEGLSKLVSA
jgi:hypothetical protein